MIANDQNANFVDDNILTPLRPKDGKPVPMATLEKVATVFKAENCGPDTGILLYSRYASRAGSSESSGVDA